MKKRLVKLQLSDEQLLFLGCALIILLAISMLYCLGFASIAVRQTWENAPVPLGATSAPGETTALPSTMVIEPTDTGTTPY